MTSPHRTTSPHWQRRRIALAGIGIALLTGTGAALANDATTYPQRPVRLVVSYGAGNVTDVLARVIAESLATKWGQPVVVENKPGQGGSLGAQIAARSAPDGYTLLFSAMAAMAVNPHVYANVGYDPRRDFAPIVNVAYPDFIVVANPQLGVKTWAQLIDYSKKNPTALNYGTAGNGTVPHLNMEAIKQRTGLQAQHVPYKSAPAVLTDVMGGRLQLQQETSAVLLPQIKAGKVVALAAGPNRHPDLPDVPSLGEVIPGYAPVIPWLGMFAPAGTPEAIVNKVNRDVREILSQPTMKARLAGHGLSVADGTPQAFAATLQKDHERLGQLAQQLHLKVD
ncbi:tripartite tricarboxylate transporter substrate binding protein [Hydrogenophaga sp. 2FB]|uniref:Bug family tripartite tricarboxylate transporter substrate binding protein n=1 Tax=Hydrogenophaga sp. 2FB TaxID=2502187 RepID=UPI0014852B21|nr:tripartite tricarboxylate transporter substrate binding protein [Hydrogenophaga sp. 2FB]